MLYLSGVDAPAGRELARTHGLGVLAQPATSYRAEVISHYPAYALDNGCFANTWDADGWRRWLELMPKAGCLFATVPDVVGDARATLSQWCRYQRIVKDLGFPRAFVLQDGQDEHILPHAEAYFIGGSTEFKLSPAARRLALIGRQRGAWVHMGRVNSLKRLRYAAEFCDSADGTFLRFGPTVNAPRLAGWLETLAAEQTLELVA